MLSKLKGRLNQRRAEREERTLSPLAREVREAHLTYLGAARLRSIEELAQGAPDGDFVECGVALGGSAILLASYAGDGRRFHGYDVFGMIPPPGESDPPEAHERYEVIKSGKSTGLGGEEYYGYRDDLLEQVKGSFAKHGYPVDGDRIQLHQGLFDDTLHPSDPVALAHVDSDWYDPVKTCLERIYPVLVPGGTIVLDDYNDFGGCRQAVDEFVAARDDLAPRNLPGGNVALTRSA